MAPERCGRCGREIGPDRAGTHYCESCMKTIEQIGSRGLWRATAVMLGLLILGGVILAIAAPTLGAALGGAESLILGLVLTIIPALLWLALFYGQDRLEPEPRSFVISLFVLGALLGGAVEQPLLREVFQVQDWAAPGTLTHLLSSTLLTGILTASLTYLAVRFTVMPTPEFDERIDGIIYGTSAALGLGVAANLTYLMEVGTISLGVGTLQLIITSLAYATFGAIVGYFLGLIRPGGGPDWLAPVGVLTAAIAHGLYEWLDALLGLGKLGQPALGYNPLPSLLVTALFAAGIFGVVFYLIRRAYQSMVLVRPEGSQ